MFITREMQLHAVVHLPSSPTPDVLLQARTMQPAPFDKFHNTGILAV